MFEYIRGILASLTPHKAVVDVGGVGYLLHTPCSTFSALPPIGEEITFYLSCVIREDSHKNFAFLTVEERDLFEEISAVSGIGPKTALALIGHLSAQTLESAIITENSSLLSKIPGIGKKTAETLIFKLRDKLFKRQKIGSPHPSQQQDLSEKDQMTSDALAALVNLGYTPAQAQKAIQSALAECSSSKDLSSLLRIAFSKT